jgi:hypothetical protein
MISLSYVQRSNMLKCHAGLALRHLLTDPKTAGINVSPRTLPFEVVITLIASNLKSWHSTRYRRRC